MVIRNRIKELRTVKGSELIPNPKNWRTHPVAQQEALRGILAEVGYADAVIARETPDGLMLVDGHLRAETTPDAEVPVLVLDINEEEADLMLATLDPLAAMAIADEKTFEGLLSSLDVESQAVNKMLSALANNESINRPDLGFLDTALNADEVGSPFPQFEVEDDAVPDVDGLVRLSIPLTPEERAEIMEVVNKVKSTHEEISTTTGALLFICNAYI